MENIFFLLHDKGFRALLVPRTGNHHLSPFIFSYQNPLK